MPTQNYSTTETIVSFKWKDALDAEQFNSSFTRVLPPGVVSVDSASSIVTKISDSSVLVGLFTVLIKNDGVSYQNSKTLTTETRDLLTKIDITSTKTLSVSPSNPYVVLDFLYSQSLTPTVSIQSVAYSSIDTSRQLILAKCRYDYAGVLQYVDIENALTKSVTLHSNTYFESFRTVPTDTWELTVKGGYLEGENVVDTVLTYVLSGENLSTTFDLPAAGYHRYDLVYVDDNGDVKLKKGQEEVDVNDDGITRPDKESLILYTFPVSYVYVSGRLRTPTSIEVGDIENLRPGFYRKPLEITLSLSDIIISNQTQFENYFGLNTLTDQGGNTPGSYADGFECTYVGGVKSVYVNRRKVAIKNQFDTQGNPIPYMLYSRVVLSSGAEIECADSVVIKRGRDFATIKTGGRTKWVVDSYTDYLVNVLSKDSYYTDVYHTSFGQQSNPVSGEEFYAISNKRPEVNGRYEIQSIYKTVKEVSTFSSSADTDFSYDNIPVYEDDTVTALSNINAPYFDTTTYSIGGIDYVIYAWVNANDSDYLYVKGYYYDTTTKKLIQSFAGRNIQSVTYTVSYVDVRVVNNGNIIVVAGKTSGGTWDTFVDNVSASPFSVGQDGEQVEGTTALVKPSFSLDSSNNLHLVGRTTSNKVAYFKGDYAPILGSTFNTFVPTIFNSGGLDTNCVSTEDFGFIVDGTNAYITFCNFTGGSYYLYGLKYNGSSWSRHSLDSSTNCGYSSSLNMSVDPQVTGGFLYYVSYTYLSTKNQVKTGKLDVVTMGLTIPLSPNIQSSDSEYIRVSNLLNYKNNYVEEITEKSIHITTFAYNTNYTAATGAKPCVELDCSFSPETGVGPSGQKSVSWSDEDNYNGKVIFWDSDYIFISVFNSNSINEGYDLSNQIIRIPYLYEITHPVAMPVSSETGDSFSLSMDYTDRFLIKTSLDGNSPTYLGALPFIDVSGSVNGIIEVDVNNYQGTSGDFIDGDNFTHNLSIRWAEMDKTSVTAKNISRVTGSNLSNVSNATLVECYNINVMAVVDGVSILGSGDFDY